MEWSIPDPLTLNTERQLRLLLEEVPLYNPLRTTLEEQLSGPTLLPTLSRLMLRPSLSMAITRLFRPLLMDLCARWLDDGDDMLDKLEAFALLIEIHEEIYPCVFHNLSLVAYADQRPRILLTFSTTVLQKGGPPHGLFDRRLPHEVDQTLLHRTLLAYYRILICAPFLPSSLNWDLSLLLKLCTAPQLDRGARWLSIRCYLLQLT